MTTPLEALDPAYSPFWRPVTEAEPDADLDFLADAAEVEGWREAPDVFRTPVWSLRDGGDACFLVGSAFDPPEPFWAARADRAAKRFRVARLGADPRIPDAYLVESVLRIVSRVFLIHDLSRTREGLVIHSGAVAIDGRMFLFLGRSGAGKSTLTRRFLDRPDGHVVNDDRMIVTRAPGAGWTAWGTPWPGELSISRRESGPLAALLVLVKSDRTSLEPLRPGEAVEAILPLLSVPWYDDPLSESALEVCGLLCTEVPVYALRCRADESAPEAVLSLAGSLRATVDPPAPAPRDA